MSILLRLEESLGWVVLDRPDRKHAWSPSMWTEMTDVLGECDSNPSCRVVLIDSTGDRVFSAGADLQQFLGASEADVKRSLEGVESVMHAIESCRVPVVAVVTGAAVGAGLEVAAACDLRIASTAAWFAIPAASLGIVITRTDINRMIRTFGGSVTRDLLMTGRRLSAEEALSIGAVHSIHPPEVVREEARALGVEIAGQSEESLLHMKRHINSLTGAMWDEEAWRPSVDALLACNAGANQRANAR